MQKNVDRKNIKLMTATLGSIYLCFSYVLLLKMLTNVDKMLTKC